MLVIARKSGETLRIGPDITVTVGEIHGRQVKLVISAPACVAVARDELRPPPPAAGDCLVATHGEP